MGIAGVSMNAVIINVDLYNRDIGIPQKTTNSNHV